jgi:rhamnose transport system permease protein
MRRNILPGLLIVLVAVIGNRLSPNFLDFAYLRDSATLVAELGLIAVGMNFIITSGNIDLSVGSNMVLTACITAKFMVGGMPAPLALLLGVGIGTLLGWLNGVLITYFRAPSFLITVATMAMYRGAAKALLGPQSVKAPSGIVGIDTQTFAGLTIPLLILLVTASIGAFVMQKTIFGSWVVAVGSNSRTALYSGVPVARVVRTSYTLTGFICGIAAMLMLSRLGLARHDLAMGSELDIITIVVVGGTAIQGGAANVIGSLLAFILIALLRSVMGVANFTAEYQMTIIGILLIGMVLANRLPLKLILQKLRPKSQRAP